ncbi:hypothetical protein VaNZ11_014456 [Volvox africanus]|uniref:Uncharacterized protein n=1 Tax=Volvox africanus TaxID=51714 RepID=A0ABQ5SJW8_9CHLO|nr:hypothetical protein VaNZ11_014456 [Volvox africanus]
MRDTGRSNYRRRREPTKPNEARNQLESNLPESQGPGGAHKRRDTAGEGGVRQCNSCGCSVPLSAWEVHVNGIRHRRNQASVTLMGEPGHLVRSIFEQDPAHIPDAYRGKDPIARRAQELRQLAEPYPGHESGMLQQVPNPAGFQDLNPHSSHQLGGHRNSSGSNNGPRSLSSPDAKFAEAAGSDANRLRMQRQGRTRGATFPGATNQEHQVAPHRRPHSEAFAELQARREQRLLGAAFQLPRAPSDSDLSPDSDSDFGSGPEANIPGGTLRPGICAEPGSGGSQLPEAAVWVPGSGQIGALVAAARREALHHTGLGPLYQASLGLLGAEALHYGARELQERLGCYRLKVDAWQRRQQHPRPALDLEDDCNSNTSGDDSSSGEEEGKKGRPWMRPYLRLGPTGLLLLSIHPSVATRESSGCKIATGPGMSTTIRSIPSNAVPDPVCSGAKSFRQRDGATGAGHPIGRFGSSSQQMPRSKAGRQGRGRHHHNEQRRLKQGKERQQKGPDTGDGDGGGAGSGPPLPQPPQAAATTVRAVAAVAATAPPPSPSPSPLRHLYLEVPFKPYGREAAAYATAMGVLLAALRRAEGSCLEAFGLRFSREEYLEVLAQGGPARLGSLEGLWQLVPALVHLIEARPGLLSEMRLSCPPGLLDPQQVECLQRASVDRRIGDQRRLAVLMGTHSRLGSSSLLRNLPREVLELVLDAALPRRPCRLVLGISKWLPAQRQRGGRPGQRDALGDALGAAAEAVPLAAGPVAWAPQQQGEPGLDPAAAVAHQQPLPRDVREAMRHAAWH